MLLRRMLETVDFETPARLLMARTLKPWLRSDRTSSTFALEVNFIRLHELLHPYKSEDTIKNLVALAAKMKMQLRASRQIAGKIVH